MLSYWLFVLIVFAMVGIAILLGIWLIARADTGSLFGFIKEGQGTFVMKAESVSHPLISARGYQCNLKEEDLIEYNSEGEVIGKRKILRYKIEESDESDGSHRKEFLSTNFGIFFFGIPPFYSRMNREFRWNEWKQVKTPDGTPVKSPDGAPIIDIWKREASTTFFFVQTFSYAIFVHAAETGGVKKEGEITGAGEGGNLSVDVKISVPVRIIYPEVALFDNEDWFEILEGIIVKCVREHVGQNTFEDLRSDKKIDITLLKEISEELILLENKEGGGQAVYCRIIDALGVRTVSVQVQSIELSGESAKKGELVAAMTAIYVNTQKAKGEMILTDAKAYDIREQANATADGIKTRVTAMLANSEDAGKFLVRQDALGEAGKGGNSIVFTNDTERGGLNEKTFAGLILNSNDKRKEG